MAPDADGFPERHGKELTSATAEAQMGGGWGRAVPEGPVTSVTAVTSGPPYIPCYYYSLLYPPRLT